MHFYEIHVEIRLDPNVECGGRVNVSYIISRFFVIGLFSFFLFLRNCFLETVYRVYHHATLSETSVANFSTTAQSMQRSVLIAKY